MERRIVIQQPSIGSLICILTNRNLYISDCFSPEVNFTFIPLEDITGLSTGLEEGIYGEIGIGYGQNKRITLLFKKPNDLHFRTSLIEAMAKKRDKIENQNKGNVFINFSSIKEYLKNGGVVMQTFKCPGCGASLEFPDNVDTTTCQFCGNKIKAVDLFEKIRNLI